MTDCDRLLLRRICRLMARTGRGDTHQACPLLKVNRPCHLAAVTSQFDPQPTWGKLKSRIATALCYPLRREAREEQGSETARVHHTACRLGSGVAARRPTCRCIRIRFSRRTNRRRSAPTGLVRSSKRRSNHGPRRSEWAVFASGGMSHFVIDEEFDRKFVGALKSRDKDYLTSIPLKDLQSGTSELKSWISLAGLLEGASAEVHEIDYVPCYRSPAGTGTANGFYWWDMKGR